MRVVWYVCACARDLLVVCSWCGVFMVWRCGMRMAWVRYEQGMDMDMASDAPVQPSKQTSQMSSPNKYSSVDYVRSVRTSTTLEALVMACRAHGTRAWRRLRVHCFNT